MLIIVLKIVKLSSQKLQYPKLEKTSKKLKYYYVKLMCVHGGVYKKKVYQDQHTSS